MISKTTINMAAKRGMDLTVSEWTQQQLATAGRKTSRDSVTVLEIADPDSDASVWYTVERNGFALVNATYGTEWPCLIEDEKHLRTLLNDMAAELVG